MLYKQFYKCPAEDASRINLKINGKSLFLESFPKLAGYNQRGHRGHKHRGHKVELEKVKSYKALCKY